MNRDNSKKKDATTPSRKNSKRGKSSTRKQSGDPIAQFDQLVKIDNSPSSVRRFIIDFVAALAASAGMTGQEYDEESYAGLTRLALKHVGADAVSIALRVAISTLGRYAPRVFSHNYEDFQPVADRYAAALAHPQCTESFRQAFRAIYLDLFVGKVDWAHPDMVRATYAPMREWLDEMNYCGNAEGIDESLLRLMETLLPEEVREASKELSEKGGAR